MSVCLSVTMLAATYLVYVSEVRQYTVSCRLLKMCCVDFAENVFRLGDMALHMHLSATMTGDSALSRQKTYQWFFDTKTSRKRFLGSYKHSCTNL